jgi:hypothetical protein
MKQIFNWSIRWNKHFTERGRVVARTYEETLAVLRAKFNHRQHHFVNVDIHIDGGDIKAFYL